MATRPIFIPMRTKSSFVRELPVEFRWHAGMAASQKQKSIESLHEQAKIQRNIHPILEISSKSKDIIGAQLSAFNLKLLIDKSQIPVEVVYQAGKIFERGGPYLNILNMSSRDAKTDPRIRDSGALTGFSLEGKSWPLQPTTAFYDWLYLRALSCNINLATQLLDYQGFSDIEFNPEKSWNCQARSAALYVSLMRSGLIDKALNSREDYFETIGLGIGESTQQKLI